MVILTFQQYQEIQEREVEVGQLQQEILQHLLILMQFFPTLIAIKDILYIIKHKIYAMTTALKLNILILLYCYANLVAFFVRLVMIQVDAEPAKMVLFVLY